MLALREKRRERTAVVNGNLTDGVKTFCISSVSDMRRRPYRLQRSQKGGCVLVSVSV